MPERSTCDAPAQSIAATRPTRGDTGPLRNTSPCDHCVNVSIGGATLDDGRATRLLPAPDASMMRVHDVDGRAGSSETATAGVLNPRGIRPVATSTRCHNITTGNRNGAPPFGMVTLTSPTKN